MSLIGCCLLVFYVSGFGKDTIVVGSLFISEMLDGQLTEVSRGEVWRLFTPIFLHFNFLHLGINVACLFIYGTQLENHSAPTLLFLVLLIAIISNFTQFILSGPAFGGFSGISYGLIGFVFVHEKLSLNSNLKIRPVFASFMMVFFVLGFVGIFFGLANWAHLCGLIIGFLVGLVRVDTGVPKGIRSLVGLLRVDKGIKVSFVNSVGLTREVKVGFSWAAFFFGGFPFFFRGMPVQGIIWVILSLLSLGISNLILPFLINKLSAHHYLENGYTPTGSDWDTAGPLWGIDTTIAKAN